MTSPGDLFDVFLVRHGETVSYQADRGLTARGRAQALARGQALAAEFGAGTRILLAHGPAERAAETAVVLAEALCDSAVVSHSGDAFGNFRVWCGSAALDPAAAYAPFARLGAVPPGERPGWYPEMERYLARQDAGADPVGYWLTTPLQYFEPAAAVVRRFWQGMWSAARRASGDARLVVCTHSGCLRAVAAAALGADPGEPHNAETVRIRLSRKRKRATLRFREAVTDIDIPSLSTPPWAAAR